MSDDEFKLNRDGGQDRIARATYAPRQFRNKASTKRTIGLVARIIVVLVVLAMLVVGFGA